MRRELRGLEHHGRANLTLRENLHGVPVQTQRPAKRRRSTVEEVGEETAVILGGASRAFSHRAHAQCTLLTARQVIRELASLVRDVAKLLARAAAARQRRRVGSRGEHPERAGNLGTR